MPIVSLKTNTNSIEKTNNHYSNIHHCNPLRKDKTDEKEYKVIKTTSLLSRQEDDLWVDISTKRLKSSCLGALYDGSRFKGVQKCGSNKYNVIVDVKVIGDISFIQNS